MVGHQSDRGEWRGVCRGQSKQLSVFMRRSLLDGYSVILVAFIAPIHTSTHSVINVLLTTTNGRLTETRLVTLHPSNMTPVVLLVKHEK